MRIGLSASTDVNETVGRCKQLGIDRVYINCDFLPGFQENGYPDPAAFREFKGRLEEKGIEVPSAHVWFGRWPRRHWKVGSTNPDVLLNRDRRRIDAILHTLEIAGENGITSVLNHIDFGRPADPDQAKACWEALIDIYREVIPVAERYGIGIGNHSFHRALPDGLREQAVLAGVRIEDYETYTAEGWGGPFLVGTWKELRRLVNAVPSPYNGVTLCTGMDIPGGDVPALVREFAGKIHFCQLRDHTDRWPAGRVVPPGEGSVDLPAIVSGLWVVGYQGFVHLEGVGEPKHPGDDPLAKSIVHAKSLIERAERQETQRPNPR